MDKLTLRWRALIDDNAHCLAWSPDGLTLAVADINGPITLFSSAGEKQTTLPGHAFGTMDICWQPAANSVNTPLLASAGQDGKIRLWNTSAPEPVAVMAGGDAWVEHLAWSPAGDVLASSAGRKIRMWDAAGTMLQEYIHPRSTVSALGWRPAQAALPPTLAVAGYGGLNLYSPAQPNCIDENQWKGSSLTLSWSPNGNFIATGDQDSTIHFWMAHTRQNLQMWGYPTKVLQLAWDSSSRYLATGGSANVVIWDCSGKGPEGRKPLTFATQAGLISALAFQPGRLILASGDKDGATLLWRIGGFSKKPLAEAMLDEPISQVVWSPDGKLLAVSTEAGDVAVFGV